MFDTVHVRSGMPLSVVLSLLAHLPARSVALVVPTQHPDVASQIEWALDTIASRASQEGKDVTLVGGTVALRARAVLAGLAAAVTLDDWRTARRYHEAEVSPWPEATPGGRPYLRLVTPAPESPAEVPEVEPPAYLRAILPHESATTFPVLPAIRLRDAAAGEGDASSARLAREADRHEEDITGRILGTRAPSTEDMRDEDEEDYDRAEELREGTSASSPRLRRSPWTRPLSTRADEAEGARLS